MSTEEEGISTLLQQRRRSQLRGLSTISELPSKWGSRAVSEAGPSRSSSVSQRRQSSSGVAPAAPAANQESDSEDDINWQQALKLGSTGTSRKGSSLPAIVPRRTTSLLRDLATARRASAGAALQRDDTDSDEDTVRSIASKPRTPPTPSLLQRRLSAASAAADGGGAPAAEAAAVDTDSDDEAWAAVRAAAVAARSSGSILVAGQRSARASLAHSGPVASASSSMTGQAGAGASASSGPVQRRWQQSLPAAEPLAKRRFASMAVPASSSLAQQPLLNERRATMPLLPAAGNQAPRQAWQRAAAPAPAQPHANVSAATGTATLQQTYVGQCPLPWPLALQQTTKEAAVAPAQLQPSFPAPEADPAELVAFLMYPATGDMQQVPASQARESIRQQLFAEPSLAAGFAEQQTGAQEQRPMPVPSAQVLPPPSDGSALGPMHSMQVPTALHYAMPQLAETPRMQQQTPSHAAQGPAQPRLSQAQVNGTGLITSIITSARSSIDAGYLGSAPLPNGAQAPTQVEASPPQQGSRQSEQRRSSTPTRDQGFTVYQNELAAGMDAIEQGTRVPDARAEPSDTKAAEMPDLESKKLQAAIVAAVQSSVQGALGTLRGDVAQLDAKLGSWWAQHEQVSQDLRQEMAAVRRGTADSIQAVAARLEQLEAAQKELAGSQAATAPTLASAYHTAEQAGAAAIASTPDEDGQRPAQETMAPGMGGEEPPAPAATDAAAPVALQEPSMGDTAEPAVDARPSTKPEAQPPALPEAAGGVQALLVKPNSSVDAAADGDATLEILKRLETLEATVACQLDQLSASQGASIAAIKASLALFGGLHASVTQAAAAASASLPGSPVRAALGAHPASPDGAAWRLEGNAHDGLPPSQEPRKAWAEALYAECAPLQQTHQQQRPKNAGSPCKGTADALAAGASALGRGGAGKHEALLRKFRCLEASHRALVAGERCQAQLAVSDAASSAALDRRLGHLEAQLCCANADASSAVATARAVQSRVAAAEWRIEKVATACAATVRALGSKQERLGGSVGQAKQAAALADAKCAALGAELARLWRESGVKRIASDTLGRKMQRSAANCRSGRSAA